MGVSGGSGSGGGGGGGDLSEPRKQEISCNVKKGTFGHAPSKNSDQSAQKRNLI